MRRLLCAACLTLVAASAATAAPSVTRLLAMVPADSAAVVVIDVAALRDHPTVHSWLLDHSSPWSGVDDEETAFLREAGLDPLRDVDLMVFALSYSDDDQDALALFAGRYDPTSLGAALEKRGAERISLAGRDVYRLDRDAAGGQCDAPLAYLGGELVIAGTERTLGAALGEAGAGSTLVAEALAAGEIDAAAPFWMVVTVPERAREAARETHVDSGNADVQAIDGLVRATAAVRRVAMFARLSDMLVIQSAAVASDAENAELIRDAVKGLVAAMRLQVQQDHPELVEVLRAVDVRVDGVTVRVSGAVPLRLLEEIAHGTPGHTEHGAD